MLEVLCTKCGATQRYVAELAGRTIFCLGCGSHFEIPHLDPTHPPTGTDSREQATANESPKTQPPRSEETPGGEAT